MTDWEKTDWEKTLDAAEVERDAEWLRERIEYLKAQPWWDSWQEFCGTLYGYNPQRAFEAGWNAAQKKGET